jgi:macrolide transport system ATP-binding/permease protein
MQNLFADLRYAIRLFLKSPVFTVVVVLTLALGIGLNTAVFSAIDALLLRPLPGTRAPEELVQVYRTYRGAMPYGSNSIPHFMDLRERSRDAFTDVAAWDLEVMNLSAAGQTQRVFAVMASADYFSVLGVTPALGRLFLAAEDSGRGAHPVAVLGFGAWKRTFGGDTGIVGRTILLNGQSYTIIGVTPAEFKGMIPVVSASLYVPLMQFDQVRPGSRASFESRGDNFMSVVARLKPGVSIAQANQRMTAIANGLRDAHPNDYRDSGINLVPEPEAGVHPMFRSAQVGLSSVVMAVVAMLLLIACVNVANLFLARARDRAKEMAIRLSLGARRSRLIRQLLTESLLFAGASGVAGLAIAWWVIGLANRITLPISLEFNPDLRVSPAVLFFTFGVSLATGLLFGLAPALQATHPSLVPALKGEAPAGASRSRTSRGLVVAQMALSIVLLVCAGLFLRDLTAVTTLNKGFVSENLLIADVDPGLQGYTRARTEDFYRRLSERMGAVPGVRAIAFTGSVPLGFSENDSDAEIPGYVPGPNENMAVQNTDVTPGYFEAMGIPFVKGHGFTAQNDSAAPGAIVVNQQFAEHFWPGKDPIGQTVRTRGRLHTVIGVVPTGKYQRLGEPPTAFMYVAQAQHWESGMSILIRTASDPMAMVAPLRAAIKELDRDLPVSDVRSMNNHLGSALLPARLAGASLGVFGVLGLALASIGLYGVMAYSVSQRTREIGIRMAIGAATGDVIRLVMRQGLSLVVIGAGVGLVGALGASRLLRGILYGGSVVDPVTFVAVPLVLVAVAAVASWLPARRAASVDPIRALRRE